MNPIIITPKNQWESRLISELLRKMKLNFKTMTDDEIEDTGMAILMKKADRSKKAGRDAVMKKLKGE
ncbi:MAG: hypothetical protein EPN93_03045 [Spirochaetes bacterium]|nr:MAG: hypothetical protein EPN93_03045 [Spirochaetota bacterium]